MELGRDVTMGDSLLIRNPFKLFLKYLFNRREEAGEGGREGHLCLDLALSPVSPWIIPGPKRARFPQENLNSRVSSLLEDVWTICGCSLISSGSFTSHSKQFTRNSFAVLLQNKTWVYALFLVLANC